MSDSTRKLSFSALIVAVGVVIICIAAFLPSGRIALAALAGLGTAAVLIECGVKYSLISFAAAALISFFLAPDKSAALAYTVFLGYYPIVKGVIERKRFRLSVEWILKLLSFNAALAVLIVIWRTGFITVDFGIKYVLAIVFIAGNVAFVAYDYVFSKLIVVYSTRISPRFKRK